MKVVFDNVGKQYKGSDGKPLVALEQINLTVYENEFVALVGPSGCGKSTLLNMAAGLLSPTSGRIYFDGLAFDRDPVIAVVFQETGLFPWRTVVENIAFGLEEAHMPRAELQNRVSYNVDLVGLAGFEDSYPRQLSGGMRQRVGIARALAIQPDLLLMDEPFSALDAQSRLLMQEELLRIWSNTMLTTLYVTHNIQEAIYLADRVIVLSRRPGRIIRDVNINLPRHDRDAAEHREPFAAYADTIWSLIRRDAQQALEEGDGV